MPDGTDPLQIAADAARAWLEGLADRPVRPEAGARAMLDAFAAPLPEAGEDPAEVVRDLAARAEPGLMANGSGRFLGWVIGAALPAADRRGLARERLGPELRDVRAVPRDHDDRAGGGRAGSWRCSTCRAARRSAS